MQRKDVEAARAEAQRFVKLCDELLRVEHQAWDGSRHVGKRWTETAWISGALTGAHRRASMDLTRALAHMRRRA